MNNLPIGSQVKVWVYLKRNGTLLDEHAHLLDTYVTNGYVSYFSRDPKTVLCGKRRAGNAGWRQAVKRNQTTLPDNMCEACQSLAIMMELAE